ncbi:MAG: DUF4386 domain-containing protein [Pseudomonadota bacterium]
MAAYRNSQSTNWLARAIGLSMLAAFAIAAFEANGSGVISLAEAAELGSGQFAERLDHEIRFGIVEIAATLATATGFIVLLKPIHAGLAIVGGALRALPAGFAAFGAYKFSTMKTTLGNAPGDAMPKEDLSAAAEQVSALNFDTFHWGLITASVGAAIGYALFFHGRMIPRVISGYGLLASLGACIGASAIYLAPGLSDLMFPAYAIANAVAYFSLMLWLLIRGVDTSYWNGLQAD